ncbi:hypothetical protein PFISCL1PPCAC_8918, partial [Pristionchus fissidentatus]
MELIAALFRVCFIDEIRNEVEIKKTVLFEMYCRRVAFLRDFFSPSISWDFYSSDYRNLYMLLYILGTLFYGFFYSALFAGNAVVTDTRADIHLKELRGLFQSDTKALLMTNLAYIKKNTLAEMFGREVIDPFYNFPPNSMVGQGMYGKERPATFYMVELWWRRYTARPRRDTTPTKLMSFDPVPIYTLKTFLIICGCLYALSIFAFIIEFVVGLMKKRR